MKAVNGEVGIGAICVVADADFVRWRIEYHVHPLDGKFEVDRVAD